LGVNPILNARHYTLLGEAVNEFFVTKTTNPRGGRFHKHFLKSVAQVVKSQGQWAWPQAPVETRATAR
jgi:hypothetical protein